MSAPLGYSVSVNVAPVRGGFIVSYPEMDGESVVYVQEVVNTVGKAMRLVKTATEAFSQVKKSEDETAAA